MTIEEFKTPFEIRLNKENRWVKLGESMPWDALARIYYRSMSSDMGAPAIDARIVIGAMIIKHKLKLDDREAVEAIRENKIQSDQKVLLAGFGVGYSWAGAILNIMDISIRKG